MSAVHAYFREQDNKVPHGVKKSQPRRVFTRKRGPWTVHVESSCGYEKPHIAGSLKITLSHTSEPDSKPIVKRLQVDNWNEAEGELTRLWDMLTSPTNKHLTLQEIRGEKDTQTTSTYGQGVKQLQADTQSQAQGQPRVDMAHIIAELDRLSKLW